jgi:hypothetical protein
MLNNESLKIHEYLLDTSTNIENMNHIQKKRYENIKSFLLQSNQFKENNSLKKTQEIYQLSLYILHENDETKDIKWIQKYHSNPQNQGCFSFLFR